MKKVLLIGAAVLVTLSPAYVFAATKTAETTPNSGHTFGIQSGERTAPMEFKNNGDSQSMDRHQPPSMGDSSGAPHEMNGQRPEPPSMGDSSGAPHEMNGQRPPEPPSMGDSSGAPHEMNGQRPEPPSDGSFNPPSGEGSRPVPPNRGGGSASSGAAHPGFNSAGPAKN